MKGCKYFISVLCEEGSQCVLCRLSVVQCVRLCPYACNLYGDSISDIDGRASGIWYCVRPCLVTRVIQTRRVCVCGIMTCVSDLLCSCMGMQTSDGGGRYKFVSIQVSTKTRSNVSKLNAKRGIVFTTRLRSEERRSE